MFSIGDNVKFIESGSIGTIGEIHHLLDYRNDRDEYTYRVQFSPSNYTWCKESELEESGNSIQNLFSESEIEKACADMDIWESTLIIQQLYANRVSK